MARRRKSTASRRITHETRPAAVSGPTLPIDPKQLAASACQVLTELIGEIHAARIIGTLALTQPGLFQTAQPHFIMRIGIEGIILAIRKFDDLYKQIRKGLLRPPPEDGERLRRQIELKQFRIFCNRVVAHYAQAGSSTKTSLAEIEQLLLEEGFDSELGFFTWTMGVLETLERIRTAIGKTHCVEESKWKPGGTEGHGRTC